MNGTPRPALDFEGLLKESSDPLFAVNPRRTLVFVNRACAELVGAEAVDLLGRECKAHGPIAAQESAGLVAPFCPPPDALQGRLTRSHALFLQQDGKRLWRSIAWVPIAGPDGHVGLVLGRIGAAHEDTAAPPVPEPLREALVRLRQQLHERFGFDQVIAACPRMRRALQQAQLASQSNVPVLLCGEAGTGKEHLARVIHMQGAAGSRPFVALDCAALDAEAVGLLLMDAPPRAGVIYLHEPARLPRDHQVALMERQQQGAVRVMAGTTAEPAKAVAEGLLLPELYYALTTLVIELPPLRERGGDVLLLAQHVIERCNAASEHQVTGITPALRELLESYPWPGNVEEFQDRLQQLHGRCRKAELDVIDLPPALRSAAERARLPAAPPERALPLDVLLEQAERRLIRLALRQARNNLSKAATRLAVSRPRLYRRMQQLGLVEPAPGADVPSETETP